MQLREFVQSLRSHLAEGGDTRFAFASSLVREPAQTVMLMEAHDLAAVISYAVAGSIAPAVKSKLTNFEDADPADVEELAKLLERYPPELVVDPTAPAIVQMIDAIKAADGGLVYVAQIAAYLAHGKTIEGLRRRMYTPTSTKENS